MRNPTLRSQPVIAAMQIREDTRARCRDLRLRAGVSVTEMARRTHRDPSSISRFERGLQTPRDALRLIAEYDALEPIETHDERSMTPTAAALRYWPLAYLAVSTLTVLCALVISDNALSDAQIGRAWVMVSLFVYAAGHIRRMPCQAIANRWGIASYISVIVALAASQAARWDHTPIPEVFFASVIAVLASAISLAKS